MTSHGIGVSIVINAATGDIGSCSGGDGVWTSAFESAVGTDADGQQQQPGGRHQFSYVAAAAAALQFYAGRAPPSTSAYCDTAAAAAQFQYRPGSAAMNGSCGAGSPYEILHGGGLSQSAVVGGSNLVGGQSLHQQQQQHLHQLNVGPSMSFSSPYDLVGPPPASMQHVGLQYGGPGGCGSAVGGPTTGGGGGNGGNTPVSGFATAGAGSPWYAPSPVSDPRFASKCSLCVN